MIPQNKIILKGCKLLFDVMYHILDVLQVLALIFSGRNLN